jgi:sugar lactone lactonase YvrE
MKTCRCAVLASLIGTFILTGAGCAGSYDRAATMPLQPTTGSQPQAVSPRGRLYVSDTLLDEIFVFPASEGAGNAPPIATISLDGEPQGLWTDQKGVLYAVVGESVEEFKPGATTPFIRLSNGIEDPIGVAVDEQRTVYVSDEETTHLAILEYPHGATSPARTILLTVPKTIFSFAGGLAFDPKGNLYATVFFYNVPPAHVYRIKRGTSKAVDLKLDDVATEAGLAADAAGNIYVGNEEGGIDVFAPGKTGPSRTISVGTEGPSLFAVSRNGELYVPYQFHETNTLLEYAAGGDESVNTLSGSFEQPFGAALAAESL